MRPAPTPRSGHFLLYSFDLLLAIYEEAWSKPDDAPAWFVSDKSLHEDYPTIQELRRAVPGLILRHNLYGIDIDLRATQIAGLALWLRAQRAYQEQGLKANERLPITRVNMVCAEPMPGERALLDEFVQELEPVVLGQLVRVVFERMKLAGEAGSLLKIEEELRDAIETAKRQWKARPRAEQLTLFPEERRAIAEQLTIYDVAQISDEAFWGEAEARVLEALQHYAERAANGQGYRRRLFAGDAARGFAFIDVCQRRYDVVLMNPPFGAASKGWKAPFEKAYLRTKNDLYAAFVERGLAWLHHAGVLGTITSRTGFFLTSFQKWREDILLKEARPAVVADLGYGVLDTATVETAAYCLNVNKAKQGIFVRLLAYRNKELALSQAISSIRTNTTNTDVFVPELQDFARIPESPFIYWINNNIRSLFETMFPLESGGRENRVGLQTSDNFRFLRLWWEVRSTLFARHWYSYAKGGGSTRYYRNFSLCVNWSESGLEVKNYARSLGNSPSRSVRSESHYFRPGITYSDRCSGGFASSPMPSLSIFDVKGSSIFVLNDANEDLLYTLSVTLSMPFVHLLSMRSGTYSLAQSFQVGQISSTPFPIPDSDSKQKLCTLALACVELKRDLARSNETSHVFHLPALLQMRGDALESMALEWRSRFNDIERMTFEYQQRIDEIAFGLYNIRGDDRKAIEAGLINQSVIEDKGGTERDEDDEDNSLEFLTDTTDLVTALLSYLAGCAFGRFDIRYATGERPTPVLPDPFAPLPACSPGMLNDVDGLPLREAPQGHPLALDADSILVDDPDHEDDIVRRVRATLDVIFGERAEAIEREACQILGVNELRDYFSRPGKGGFWDDHIKRYSKSRRKAPIYWLLQSQKKNYALWLYYHRLDKDTLFKAQVTYVEPKIRLERERLTGMQARRAGLAGRDLRQLEREIDRQDALISDLEDFRDRLVRAAQLYLEPDHNDGVVLTIAPLWELVPWKEAKQYWNELLAGKYEWSSIGKQLREKGLVK